MLLHFSVQLLLMLLVIVNYANNMMMMLAGRYRTSAQFFADVRYVLESTMAKAITQRMHRRTHNREMAIVQELVNMILSFLQDLQLKVVV